MDDIADDFRRLNMRQTASRSREDASPREDRHNRQWIQREGRPSARGTEHVSPTDRHTPRFPPPNEDAAFYGLARTTNDEIRPATPGRSPKKPYQNFSRRPSIPSPTATYSLYPAPSNPPISKPLPPLPLQRTSSRRAPSKSSSNVSVATSDFPPSRYSQSSRGTDQDRESTDLASPRTPVTTSAPKTPVSPERQFKETAARDVPALSLRVAPWKSFTFKEKAKDPSVYYLDPSVTSNTLASKHGSNAVTFWNVSTGQPIRTVKISAYTQASSRGREYFIRSHAILSEPSMLAAIATGFGNTIEVWNWGKDKHVQTINGASRWAAKRSDLFESSWPPLAVYDGESRDKVIDLYTARRDKKKPFTKAYTINLLTAGLPFVPQYPELAFSATGPLLVAAAGPRPPRVGHPPPERQTLLVAWELSSDGDVMNTNPYRIVKPWQHSELDTALPCSLAAYGSVVVSIWIPAAVRAVAVPQSRGGQGYCLLPVPVPNRHVLVWDFSANSTRTFSIPNTTSAVSPDCRYVAYCDASGTEHGARGKLAILDALTGRQRWVWPDPDATEADNARMAGFEQLGDLGHITELAFSEDGGFLFIGDGSGVVGVYDIREADEKNG